MASKEDNYTPKNILLTGGAGTFGLLGVAHEFLFAILLL